MYNSQDTVARIKLMARSKKIILKDMLVSCELNKNTLSSMQSRGSWLQANSLAKIADYLGCSIDYLLGRTDNPNIIKQSHTDKGKSATTDSISNSGSSPTHINISDTSGLSEQEKDLLRIYRNSKGKDQVKIMSYIYNLEDEYTE